MTDLNTDDWNAELASVIEDTRRHLEWLQDAGIRALPVEALARAPAAPTPRAQPPASSSAMGHTRPAFLDTPPQRPPAPPPAPPLPAARPAPAPASAPPPAPAARMPPPAPSMPLPVARSGGVPPEATAASPEEALRLIRGDLGNCTRCALHAGRTNLVFGEGNPRAEILFLGEGPGEDEDSSGRPFVGRAGQLLDKMIQAMGYQREDVYICNVVKSRPPGNRRPEPAEIEACRPFAERQIRAIRPKVIVALGATAAQSLLRTTTPITRLRNRWTSWEGIPVMPTFHPSYLLRAPDEKRKAWDDLKLVLAKLGRQPPPQRRG